MNTTRLTRKALPLLITVMLVSFVFQEAKANTYNIADGDVAGLIAAVNSANANPGPDTINLAPGGTYTFTSPTEAYWESAVPIIGSPITFNGNGATIERSNAAVIPFRLFAILNGDVHLDRITIRGGRLNGTVGGGLYVSASSLVITNSTITENFGESGGGMWIQNSTATIENTTISNNSAFGGYTGGGILSFANATGAVKISNSTIFENRADGPPGAQGRGDAIADNFSAPGSVVIKNSIIASPTRGVVNDCQFFTPDSRGHNIFSDSSCGQNVAGGDLIIPNLTLGPLANNGGPTQTHALLPGSAPVDAIPIPDCTNVNGLQVFTDQRGEPRPIGLRCDIGAFETGDSIAPITNSSLSVTPNAAGWNNTDLEVSLSAADESGGSGVKELTYSATGAQVMSTTTVSASSAAVNVFAEGETTITFFATDNSGNTESPQTLTVRIDKSSPSVSCGVADGAWHSNDVSLPCLVNDTLSGLANAGDNSFNLSTSIPTGSETANASTDSRTVCDLADNCASAGPISSNKVDKRAPVITIAAPTAGTYLLNQSITVNFNCSDGGSGVGSCIGTTTDGGQLDTSTPGAKTFTVSASDNVGNSAPSSVVNYTVNFGLQVLFDQTKTHKSGSTVPVKIRLVDANGANVSSAATLVHAVSVVKTGSQSSAVLDDAGNANPDFDFRYDAGLGGYIFNLKTTGFGTGTYVLNFAAGGGSAVYSVGFQVRQ